MFKNGHKPGKNTRNEARTRDEGGTPKMIEKRPQARNEAPQELDGMKGATPQVS